MSILSEKEERKQIALEAYQDSCKSAANETGYSISMKKTERQKVLPFYKKAISEAKERYRNTIKEI